MAMISCPACGESISDKAKKCVHCGFVLTEEPQKKFCRECGTQLELGATECPNCGCPVGESSKQNTEQTPQQVEVTKINIKPRVQKKVIIIAIIALIVVIASIFGYRKAQENKAKEISADYGKNLESITLQMLSGASDAESCGNLIEQVWHNSIYEKTSYKTDKYTKPDGYFVSDFNKALKNLFADDDFSKKISDIKDNQNRVTSKMKEMKNPPEEWKDAYKDLQAFYDSYNKLINLATDPTGNLTSFSSGFNDADTEVSNAYNKMKIHMN